MDVLIYQHFFGTLIVLSIALAMFRFSRRPMMRSSGLAIIAGIVLWQLRSELYVALAGVLLILAVYWQFATQAAERRRRDHLTRNSRLHAD